MSEYVVRWVKWIGDNEVESYPSQPMRWDAVGVYRWVNLKGEQQHVADFGSYDDAMLYIENMKAIEGARFESRPRPTL